MQYGKLLLIYLLSCIVCSLIFSVFYYIHIINSNIYQWGNFFCSILTGMVILYYLIQKTEKKAFLSVGIFLGTLLILTLCLMPFFEVSFLRLMIRIFVLLIFVFFVLIRK